MSYPRCMIIIYIAAQAASKFGSLEDWKPKIYYLCKYCNGRTRISISKLETTIFFYITKDLGGRLHICHFFFGKKIN